ncbi:unnamed protein product, partial [Musa textilis]
ILTTNWLFFFRWFCLNLSSSCGFLVIRSFFVIVLGSRDGSSLPWWSIFGTCLIFCDYMQLD